ncbi:MAG: hypothetical protein KAS15_01800 [Nanoarchaeota archaeon]|nr:hypothetical protein [Nanoarchaeota archaeon]MCK5629879.1 hypothetical protein [Nanoarchaeota archaeon]
MDSVFKAMANEFKTIFESEEKLLEKECVGIFQKYLFQAYAETKAQFIKLEPTIPSHPMAPRRELDTAILKKFEAISHHLTGGGWHYPDILPYSVDGFRKQAEELGISLGIFVATFEFGIPRFGGGINANKLEEQIKLIQIKLQKGMKVKTTSIKKALSKIIKRTNTDDAHRLWMIKFTDIF